MWLPRTLGLNGEGDTNWQATKKRDDDVARRTGGGALGIFFFRYADCGENARGETQSS